MSKLFPSPRIETDKIPECKPHIKRGEHLKLYRWSPNDFKELSAVFNGPHPETGEELEVAEELHPEGAPAYDLPPQPAVFAPGPEAGEIEEIAQKLREAAGLPKNPTGVVAQEGKVAKAEKSGETESEKMKRRGERLAIYLSGLPAGSAGGEATRSARAGATGTGRAAAGARGAPALREARCPRNRASGSPALTREKEKELWRRLSETPATRARGKSSWSAYMPIARRMAARYDDVRGDLRRSVAGRRASAC